MGGEPETPQIHAARRIGPRRLRITRFMIDGEAVVCGSLVARANVTIEVCKFKAVARRGSFETDATRVGP
jgi:hypothetical protein